MQAAVLNTLTELRQFNKIKASKRAKKTLLELQLARYYSGSHVSIVAENTHQDNAQCMGRCVWAMARWDISRKYATAKEVG